MNFLMKLLDSTTMYRVVLYVLVAYVALAYVLSLTGQLFFSVSDLSLSLVTFLISGTIIHYLCARIWEAPANIESTVITALILFLLFDPTSDLWGLVALAGVMAIAVVSKYVVAYRKLHIINPVAFAAVAASLLGIAYATWWVGNYAMFAVVLIGGLLITAKIRRWKLVAATVLSALLVNVIVSLIQGGLSFESIQSFFFAWPIIFFATVMVTEPLSTPSGERMQVVYGVLIGGLSSVPFVVGPLYSSPELALVVGNIALYYTTLRSRLVLTLSGVREIAAQTYEYVFTPSHSFSYEPGQYLEWTLPHQSTDKRGIRRYFTIASSPTEEGVMLGLKIPEKSSRFKQMLSQMEEGDVLYATSRDGDFTLPEVKDDRHLVFIAGGIGITPFRSMIAYMRDTDAPYKVTLFNCNNTEADIPWQDVWQNAAKHINLTVVDVLGKPSDDWQGERGYIDQAMLERHIDSVDNALFYVSGPPGMVNAYKKVLRESGVRRENIKTDFFPGLA